MKRIGWFAASAILVLTASAGRAQDSASHIRIGEWEGGNNSQKAQAMAQMLKERVGGQGTLPQVEPELIKKLLDVLKKDGAPGLMQALDKNPELRRAFSNLDQSNPELRRQLENLRGEQAGANGMSAEQIQRLIEKFSGRGLPEAGNTKLPEIPNLPRRTTPEGSNTHTHPEAVPHSPSRTSPSPERFPPPETAANDSQKERFAGFLERMKNWFPKSLKDSPNFKRFADRIGGMDWTKRTSRIKFWPEGKGPKINWSGGFQNTGRFFDRMFGGIGGRRMPNLPNAPRLPNAPNLPSVGAPSAPGSFQVGRGFTVVMVLGAVALGAFLFWRLVVKPMNAHVARSKAAWSPGPWPVDPSQVRTRDEVIRAFDYLALLNGGKPAQMWHHREVANRLGIDSEERHLTADRLAQVYESARYAPPVEPLAEGEIEVARRDICSLAGVGSP